jgi:hypothetical protein
MNHHPSDDSANVPPSGQAVVAGTVSVQELQASYHLTPSLQKALSCLDIKLEDELTRFRSKQQDDSSYVNTSPTGNSSSVHDRSPATSVTWEQQSVDFDADSDVLTAEILQPSMSSDSTAAPQKGGFIIIDGLTTSVSNSRSAIATVNYAPLALHRSDRSSPEMDLNFAAGGEISPFQEEYSSSSQELLRQIQSGYPAAENHNPQSSSPTTPRRKYLTPVKVGSMAAVCLLAGGAVYTYLNPGILAPLTAKAVSPTTALGQLIQSPNLAANEFTELNLSTLNTIKLPTVTAANANPAPARLAATPTGVSTAPVAIPFKGTQVAPQNLITSQPRLADSLVRSLLPSNFHSSAKPSGYRVTPSQLGR